MSEMLLMYSTKSPSLSLSLLSINFFHFEAIFIKTRSSRRGNRRLSIWILGDVIGTQVSCAKLENSVRLDSARDSDFPPSCTTLLVLRNATLSIPPFPTINRTYDAIQLHDSIFPGLKPILSFLEYIYRRCTTKQR